jgi:hypothetical protein
VEFEYDDGDGDDDDVESGDDVKSGDVHDVDGFGGIEGV